MTKGDAAIATSFRPPRDRADADARVTALKGEILRIQRALEDPDVRTPDNRRRLHKQEYFDWADAMRKQIAQMRHEIGYLELQIKLMAKPVVQTPKAEPSVHLLWRCSQLLRRLVESGVPFTADDRRLMEEISERAKLKVGNPLKEARAMVKGSPQNLFVLGSHVACTTRDEMDLRVLEDEWGRLKAQRPIDEDLLCRCARDYLRVLAAYNRLEEAVAIASHLTVTGRDVARVWLDLGQATKNETVLEHARTVGSTLEPEHRYPFFVGLYGVSGRIEDVRMATPPAELASKIRINFSALLRHHTAWQRVMEAREALRHVTIPEDRVLGLAHIAEVSGEQEDVDQLTVALVSHRPSRVSTVRRVTSVLAANNRDDVVAGMLDATPAWSLRCAGYAGLARFMRGARALEYLDRAEQTLIGANSSIDTIAEQALIHLMYAQGLKGRMDGAVRIPEIMSKGSHLKCVGHLLLHVLSTGEELPEFMVSML